MGETIRHVFDKNAQIHLAPVLKFFFIKTSRSLRFLLSNH